MVDLQTFAKSVGDLLDAAGVLVILGGFLAATLIVFIRVFRTHSIHHLYKSYRRNLARSILVGLEFLVAGDIIRSVAGDLTFNGVVILAIIVVIRSFLGMEFEMEIDGHWPWNRSKLSKKEQSDSL